MRQAERIRYLALAAQREGDRRLTHELKPLGLTSAQSEVLRILGESQPLSVGGLGEQLVCDSGSNPSRLVERMVVAGLVERKSDASDRRQVTLTLTSAGRALERRVREVEDRLYADLDAACQGIDVVSVIELLERMTAGQPAGNALNKRIASSESQS